MDNLEIKESYKDYKPPVNIIEVIQTLIRYVPHKYLTGLKTIVLTNSTGLSRNRRRSKTLSRRRKVQISGSLGLYHQQWKETPAWIEIFVDNVVNTWPNILLKIPPIRDIAFAGILYHELGHHIHKVIRPEYSEREDVAEKWDIRLTRSYVRKRYWYLLPLLYPIYILAKIGKRSVRLIKSVQS